MAIAEDVDLTLVLPLRARETMSLSDSTSTG
jgi:hypothetical protein